VRGLNKDIDDEPASAPVLQPLKERAERVIKDLEERRTTGLAAMDLLAALAAEKEAALDSARKSGLSPQAFAVYWTLRADDAFRTHNVDATAFARDVDALLQRYPTLSVNLDEQRRFRAALYKPLLALSREERARVVDSIMKILQIESER